MRKFHRQPRELIERGRLAQRVAHLMQNRQLLREMSLLLFLAVERLEGGEAFGLGPLKFHHARAKGIKLLRVDRRGWCWWMRVTGGHRRNNTSRPRG